VNSTPRDLRAGLRVCAVVVATMATVATGVAAAGPLRSTVYVNGLTRPVAFVQDPSDPDLQFVVEQGGRIRVIRRGVLVAAPFLDITTSVASDGERGLLGLAFAPDYATSRRFFVSFTRADGDLVVARFTRSAVSPLVADPTSRFDLVWSTGLSYIEHSAYPNHYGGHLTFGPDGYLYVATGDGGGRGDPQDNAQSANSLLGKMLRVDVAVPESDPEGFDIPADNPFLHGLPVPARPEIWAFGLRNPRRWSFDDPARGGTGALILGDSAEDGHSEIDYEPAKRGGRNYGWSAREGSRDFPTGGAHGTTAFGPVHEPVYEVDGRLARSIIGGHVYRGRRLGSAYAGRYFFGDAVGGRLLSLALTVEGNGEAVASDFKDHTSGLGKVGVISAFGVDASGEIYIVRATSGEILRLLADEDLPAVTTLVSPSGVIGTTRPAYTWTAVSNAEWYYLWIMDSVSITVRQWFTASAAGCASGTGLCSVAAPAPVRPGPVYWWVQTWNSDGYGPWSAAMLFTPSVPGQVTTVSPTGPTPTPTPSFTWNASPLASYYYLWVNNAAGAPVLRQWYTAAAAGCPAGTGTCTIAQPVTLGPGRAVWWIQTWNDVGYGPWSAARPFTITPAAATLVSPTGTIGTATPTYTWNAVPTTAEYNLWVNDASGTVRIRAWYTAAAAGCAAGTGTCSVTPGTPLATGAATWWIQTWNPSAYGPWSAAMPFTVSPGITITSANAATFTVGVAGTFTVTTVAIPSVTTIARGGVSLPGGMTYLDNGDGTATLSGTPSAGTGGTYALTFTATNGVHTPAVQNFTLTVQEEASITSANATTFSIGGAGSFSVTTTGFPDPALLVTGALPSGVTFVDNGDGTATLGGTPAVGTGGTYPLTFTADNGVGADAVQNFTLTVNQGPVFTSANATTFTVGAAGSFTITTTGIPPITTITRGGDALPGGVSYVDNGDGTAALSGTPNVGTGGVYNLTFTINNGVGGNVVQNFTLTVTEGPAFTSAASTTFTVGSAGSFTVTTTGEPDVTTITLGGAALPTGVTFVNNGNGTATLSGTPGAGTGGTYALTFTANNGIGGNVVQNFTLTVNQAPTFTSATSTTFTVGSAGSFTITTDGFPAITTITRGGASLPAGVSYVDNGNGTATLSGTPQAGTSGAYALTFTINNGVGGNVVQNFTLNVNEPPAITSANNTIFTVGTPGTFTVTATGFPTPTVTHTSGTLPTGVTFTSATRLLAGTATQTGAFPIVFTAANGVGSDAIQNFTLNVVCPAITVTPTTMTDGLYQTVYGGVDFNQTGSTGSSFTWGATGLPAGLSINVGTGVVSGTPTDTVLNAAVTVTVTDNFGCVGTRNTTLTVRPTTDNENYTGGVGNTQYVVAAAGVATPHVLVNDNVKTGDNGPGALTVTFNAPANGSVAEGGTDGTFIYTPNLNFAGPSDSFTYTLTDGNGVTNTGTVTINLSNLVWYVNSSGGNGDGRSHNPFNTLASAATASAANSYIYVHSGGATTPGNLAMDTGQALVGQGATFTLNGLTILSGTRPTLTGTVTLANTTSVTAVNFTPSGIPALTATGVSQPITIDQVNVTGGTNAVSLTNVTGAVTVTNASFTNTSGAEVLISGGTSTVNIGATISSNAGRSIDIQSRTGGTVTFSGSITDTGTGIFLDNNDNSTINFTGALSLSTGTNPGFTATNGGTVSNSNAVVNTITTTTGIALNVANTTIGSGGLTFRSISSNGAVNGIVLNTLGSSGGLTVTGNSSGLCGGQVSNSGATVTAPVSGDCSGGSILSSSGTGVLLTNTAAISLTRMRIASSGDDGIGGSGLGGLTLTSTLIESNGNAVGDRGIDITNLTGTGAIANSTIRGSSDHNVFINNTSGTLSSFNVTNSQFATPSFVTGDDGILLLTDGAGSITASITQSAFTDNKGDHFQAASTASATGPINVTFSNNTLLTTAGNDPNVLGGGITISPSGSVDLTFTIANNNIQQAFDDAINLNLGTASTAAGSMVGTISNNTIGNAAEVDSGSESSNTITVTSNGAGTTTVAVTGNVVRQYGNGYGILINAKEGSSTLNATVTGNTVSNPGTFAINGIRVDAGATSGPPADTGVTCAAITGNSVVGSGLSTDDIRLRQRFNTTIRLPGYAGANNDTAAVNAFVSANNTGGPTVSSAHNVGGGGGGFVGGAACQTP
jgi:large repetitive protein